LVADTASTACLDRPSSLRPHIGLLDSSALPAVLFGPTDVSASIPSVNLDDTHGIEDPDDPMAIAGLDGLQECGIEVPHPMSTIGFDGTERHVMSIPSLTTIEADPEHWGAAAARTLLSLVDDGRRRHRATDGAARPCQFHGSTPSVSPEEPF
jgi:DNA-binding LacI/PurR family transcriptional regulator